MVSHAELLKQVELTAVLKKLERLDEQSKITDEVASDIERAIRCTTQLIISMQNEMDRLGQKVA